MSGIHFPITGDNTSFINAMNGVRKEIDSTTDIVKQSGGDIDRVISKLSTGLASLGVAFSAQQLVSQVVKVRGEFQQLEVAFKTMLGSAEKADALLSQLTKTAAVTPFGLQDVASGAKQLLAYGISAENVNDTLVRLGDIAAGLSIPLGDLVYLYGTTMTQGRMFTMDLRQFMGRGIPIAEELANIFGVAKDEVAGLVTAGKVTSDVFAQAINNMTSSGSKFGGLMEAQSKTITGQISNIQDAIDVMLNEIGQSNEDIINASLQATSKLVENWRTVIDVIGEAVVAYGAYRAVLMTATAYKGVEANASADIEIAGLTELLAVKEKNNNADLQEAVNAGTLSQVKAEKVAELRKELKAQLEVLNSKKDIALAEEAEALKSLEFAQQKKATADQELESVMTYWENASKISEAKADELYLDKIQTAQLNANSAATQLNTAQKNYNTASSNAKAASTAADTLQTQMNTVANNANAVSMNFMKAAGVQLTGMFKALKTAIMSNPLGMIATLITAVGYGMYKLITYETEAEKSQKRLNETFSKAEGEIAKEITKLDRLKGKMSALKEGSKEYEGAKKELIALASSYDAELGKEIEKVGLTEQAYSKLTLAIKKSILERAKASRQNEIDQEYADSFEKATGKLLERLTKKLGDEEGAKVYQKIVNKAIEGGLGFVYNEKGQKELSTIVKKQGKYFQDEELKYIKNVLDTNFGGFDEANVIKEIQNLINAEKKRKRDTQQNDLRFGFATQGQNTTSTGGGKEPQKTQNKAYWEDLKKKAEEELEALSVEELNTEKALEIRKKIYEYEVQIAKYDIKKNKDVEKHDKKKKDIISTLIEQNDDNRISLLEEGYEKTIEIIDNAYNDAISEIDKKAEELKAINKEKGLGAILTPEEQVLIDDSKKLAGLKRNKAVTDIYKNLADKYKSFDQKRRDIDKQYQEDMAIYTAELNRLISEGLDTSALESSMDELEKVYKKSIKDLNEEIVNDMQGTELWARMFTDASKMSSESLKVLIKDVKVLLDYLTGLSNVKPKGFTDEQLSGLSGNIEAIKTLFDQYNEAVDALDDKTDYPFSNLIKGFRLIKTSGKTAEKALEATDKKAKENLKNQSDLEKSKGLSYLQKGAVDVADAFSYATDILQRFAEVIPNDELKEKAELFSSFSSVISSTAQGAATGGWVGAAVGAVTSVTDLIISGFIQAQAEEEEFLQNTRNFAYEYQALMLSINDSEFSTPFGDLSTAKGQDAIKKAQEAAGLYAEAVGKKINEVEEKYEFKNLGVGILSSLGTPLGALSIWGMIEGFSKEQTNETKKLLEAVQNGYTELQGMAVKTKDYNGFMEFFGKKDEYMLLKDLAPELWGDNGEFNIEAAEKFLQTNTQISQEQRDQIQNAINLGRAYEQAIAEVDELISSTFGNMANDLTDIIFNSVQNGTDAWSDFQKVGYDTITSLGKTMLKEIMISTYFDNYRERMRNAYLSENPAEELANITTEMFNGMKTMIPEWQEQAEYWDNKAKEAGFTPESQNQDQASKRGFEGMSQETASELNGRFTALQVSGEEIKNQMFNVVFRMDSMLSLATTNNTLLSDIREAHATTNGHLEDMVKMFKTNNEHLISINNSLSKI